MMRSIGQNPTEDEVLELIMESDLNGDGTIDFKEFINMMRRKSADQDQTEVRDYPFTCIPSRLPFGSPNVHPTLMAKTLP